MMQLSSINTEQGLYVMPCGNGYSCYGFDVLDRKARAVAAWIPCPAPDTQPGTSEHFDQCAVIMEQGANWAERKNARCPVELVPDLVGLEGRRVEVVDCYGERRRFKVGKSTGWLPCHLELANSGGPAAMGTPYKSVRVVS